MNHKIINLKNLLILGLMILVLTGCLPKKSQEGGEAEKEESYSGTLEKMMGLGIPLKCEWKKDENYYGASWVKGKKSYGEVAQEGRMVKMIWKDDCMWVWEEGNPQGTKMCMEVSEEEMEEMAEESQQMMEEQGYQPTDIDYQCRPAIFGDEKFNPPGEVNFMDVGQMMEGLGQ